MILSEREQKALDRALCVFSGFVFSGVAIVELRRIGVSRNRSAGMKAFSSIL